MKALPLLVERSREQRDQLAAAVAQAAAALAQAERTLAQLDAFRADYIRRAPSTSGQGLHVDRLVDYQRFVTRLDQAVALQRQECAIRRDIQAQAQGRLAEGQRRLTAFEALVRRQADALALRAQRQAQRESDEFAARAVRAATHGSPT